RAKSNHAVQQKEAKYDFVGRGVRIFDHHSPFLVYRNNTHSSFCFWPGFCSELATGRFADSGDPVGLGLGPCRHRPVAEAAASPRTIFAGLRLVPQGLSRRSMADDGKIF